MRPPYSTNGPCSRCRRRKTAPRSAMCGAMSGGIVVTPHGGLGLGRDGSSLVGLSCSRRMRRQVDAARRPFPRPPRGSGNASSRTAARRRCCRPSPPAREHLLEDVEMNRRLVVRRRHEDAARRRDPQPEHGRRIEVGEEDQDVELLVAVRRRYRAAPGTTALLLAATPSRRRAVCGVVKIQSE